MYYKQCEINNGVTCEVVWLPEKFAIENKHIKVFEQDYTVAKVYTTRLSFEYLKSRERDHLNHRKVTDI